MAPRPTHVILALLGACSQAGAEQQAVLAALQEQATAGREARVEVVVLQPTEASLRLELPGEVVGSQDALLASALGGLVEEVRVEAGDAVRKGEALVVVDRATHAAELARAEASLAQAQADLRRIDALGDLGAPAQRESLATNVALAEAVVQGARTRAERAVIRAPFDGVVGAVAVDPGEAVAPGGPAVRLVALDPVHVVLSVSDRDVVALAPDLPARVRTAARADLRAGRVAHVGPVADLSTRSFLVEVEVPNPGHTLLPGMIAVVEVDRTLEAGAVVLPQEWLVTRLDGYGAVVLEGSTARWREVTLGQVVRGQVVVTAGLSIGDRVVVTGQQSLVDGDPVIVSREGRCCEDGRPVF